MPLAQAIPYTNSGENLAGRLVICTAFGIKTIDVSTGAEIPDGEDVPDNTNECIICLASAIGIIAQSNGCEIKHLQISSLPVEFPLSPLAIFYPQHLPDAHRARAPPIA